MAEERYDLTPKQYDALVNALYQRYSKAPNSYPRPVPLTERQLEILQTRRELQRSNPSVAITMQHVATALGIDIMRIQRVLRKARGLGVI
jgi:DNA-directed RNA polymerase sigma subunit (sigma70/sigma32)